MQSQQGPDPTALIGLPLMRLAAMLRESGVRLP
jgi:predicted house-cleaning NTP pyrophosphatase (Maf/HAM1 superfamily)